MHKSNIQQPTSSNQNPAPSTPKPESKLATLPRYKIARLPQAARDSLNLMLLDRVPYHKILRQLGEAGKTLNKDNLLRWKRTGYKDWLKEHQAREAAQAKIRFILSLVQENKNSQILQASQQIAALQVADLLTAFDLPALKQSLQDDGANYIRLLNALPRISQGGLACELQRVEVAKRRATLKESNKPKRGGITKATLHEIESQINLL
jgi:phage-related protein